ncbi:response regulator transcription factor [Pelagibacterium nitratireducens]|jgi:two-component system, OmpR family, response regulator|uniref:Response regulator transcription factor n=1 Tax=Pelagibacterium nitratireducens TaxID=1046114 RepID=A0ABZ2I0K9_9HYPH|nr:DNA-binding response regulator [Pelagibacterium sp.]HCO54608.1 DNA-binding response regulator [Pelagibacterium sp.]|tara:strand:- start:3835 stop:4503 length:669 start_codon:yes stop_codon:yes gene_type:complete
MRILLVEDENEMANVLRSALARHSIVVDHAASLEIAREASLSHTHDAVLLDRKLPDGEGLSLIPELRRQNPALPIIVLSALGSLDNRVIGLDEGADDYLAKPFSIDELMARLRAVLRRPAQMRSETLMIGALEFEPEHNAVRINGQPVDLPRRELLALEALIRRAGRTVSRDTLEQAVYGFDDDIASNALDAHLSRLRRKLAAARVEIHAIRGIGYLLREVQ